MNSRFSARLWNYIREQGIIGPMAGDKLMKGNNYHKVISTVLGEVHGIVGTHQKGINPSWDDNRLGNS